jgi:Tfp pilus assembly protein PilF
MDNNTTQLALSELHSCHLYLDRIYQGLNEFTDIGHLPLVKKINVQLIDDLREFFSGQILQISSAVKEDDFSPGAVRDFLHHSLRFMETAIQLRMWSDEEMTSLISNFMNRIYLSAQELHQVLEDYTHLEIQLPRPIILDSHLEEGEKVPLFYLDPEKLTTIGEHKESSITSIDGRREKQYRQLISKGHKYMVSKKYEKATEAFQSAQNYDDSAEVMTLIAWSFSLRGKMEKAKNFCLQAIQKDPNYGPPYNDLGNYLLQEGHGEEALKWFELAKKCSHYQNREYPYINAGRVYLSKREFKKAFEEFSKALSIAPNHQELHQTINRLKKTIEKSERKQQTAKNHLFPTDGPPPPPIF